MTTDAQRKANQKYYAKVCETRRTEMRERAKTRMEQTREYLREHPEEVEAYQKALREKKERYIYNSKVRRMTTRVDGWLEDPGICSAFKEFLRGCVVPVIGTVPESFLDTCWDKLAIALKSAEPSPEQTVDAS
jgi:hypothetical protein